MGLKAPCAGQYIVERECERKPCEERSAALLEEPRETQARGMASKTGRVHELHPFVECACRSKNRPWPSASLDGTSLWRGARLRVFCRPVAGFSGHTLAAEGQDSRSPQPDRRSWVGPRKVRDRQPPLTTARKAFICGVSSDRIYPQSPLMSNKKPCCRLSPQGRMDWPKPHARERLCQAFCAQPG